MRSIFRRSKLHRKLVGQRHGAIAVLVREIGGRSDLRNDSLPSVVEGSYIAPSLCLRVKFQNLFGRLEAKDVELDRDQLRARLVKEQVGGELTLAK